MVKHENLRTDVTDGVYESYLHAPRPTGVQFYVRTTHDPGWVMSSIREAIHKLDPMLAAALPARRATSVDPVVALRCE